MNSTQRSCILTATMSLVNCNDFKAVLSFGMVMLLRPPFWIAVAEYCEPGMRALLVVEMHEIQQLSTWSSVRPSIRSLVLLCFGFSLLALRRPAVSAESVYACLLSRLFSQLHNLKPPCHSLEDARAPVIRILEILFEILSEIYSFVLCWRLCNH